MKTLLKAKQAGQQKMVMSAKEQVGYLLGTEE